MIDINKTKAKYLVLDLETYETREEEKGPMEDPAILNDNKCRTTELWLRRIEPGTFTMGSPEDELGRYSNETQHQVTLTKAYYIGVFETTQKQYELITGRNPSGNKGDVRPVECVSFDMLRGTDKETAWPASCDVDEASFLGILRDKTQMPFDLPTEAQWEYACRAGTTTAFNTGYCITDVLEHANMTKVGRYKYNSTGNKYDYSLYLTHSNVGSFLPNAWGLYDMHGNVWEWCLDWFAEYNGDAINSKGAPSGDYRVLRGGSWYHDVYCCRSACRSCGYPNKGFTNVGFRVVVNNRIQRDFEFEISSGTENTLPVFEVKLYGQLSDGKEYPLEEMGKVKGNGAPGIVIGKGKQKLTWTQYDDCTNPIDEVTLRVEYTDVTSRATYLVLDLVSNKMRVSTSGPDLTNNKCKTTELWLRRIEPGTFIMGSPKGELGRRNDESQHRVKLTRAYYIGVFETTQKQYEIITGTNPSHYKGDALPVESVSYDMIRGCSTGSGWPDSPGVDKDSFMGRQIEKTGIIFDLPTEAQWEYACRAGTATSLNSGHCITDVLNCANMAKVGRYYNNINDWKGGFHRHTTVGSYLPNAWGLYDMHGNVREWCLDWYQAGLHNTRAIDPKGASHGKERVLRGGSWHENAVFCRSAYRGFHVPSGGDDNCGFRVAIIQQLNDRF